jgi:hypothetical protein
VQAQRDGTYLKNILLVRGSERVLSTLFWGTCQLTFMFASQRSCMSHFHTKLAKLMFCITRSLAFCINRRPHQCAPSFTVAVCHKKIRLELFSGASLFVSLAAAQFIVLTPLRRIVVGPFVVTDLSSLPNLFIWAHSLVWAAYSTGKINATFRSTQWRTQEFFF